MSPESKGQWLVAIRPRYVRASKVEKSLILNEFCAVCGYQRKYAIRKLRRLTRPARRKPGRKRYYGPELLAPLKRIWLASGQLCSKRLGAAMPLWLPHYEARYGTLDPTVRGKLLTISPATMDRLLHSIRARHGHKGFCATRPGTLLRTQIPIRTHHWDVTRPGFLEADSVAHCGTSLGGDYVWSLTFTDIYSAWTECRAVWNKGAAGVVGQVRHVEARLPFAVLGFDCDNGSEFLNHHLWHYFARRKKRVEFTRSRPYRKNDNAHVEQKQWTHVRQLLGYDRLDDARIIPLLNSLYAREWSLLQNFFAPSFKLRDKTRINSRFRRRYYPPQTPCQRLLECNDISEQAKDRLRERFQALDPFTLKKALERKLKIVFLLLKQPRDGVNPPASKTTPQQSSLGSFFQ